MLVDDDPDNNRIFAIALRDNGLEVDAFEDPQLALSAFKPTYYDFVILDITMPRMYGDELYQKLRKIDKKFKFFLSLHLNLISTKPDFHQRHLTAFILLESQ